MRYLGEGERRDRKLKEKKNEIMEKDGKGEIKMRGDVEMKGKIKIGGRFEGKKKIEGNVYGKGNLRVEGEGRWIL